MGIRSNDRRRRFQSTRPARGATRCGDSLGYVLSISIHAPREGRDPRPARRCPARATFQSTRPARGATGKPTLKIYDLAISIHAPREGRDLAPLNHAPDDVEFQSTRPARGATGIGYELEPEY